MLIRFAQNYVGLAGWGGGGGGEKPLNFWGRVEFYDDVIPYAGSSITWQIKTARVGKNTDIGVRFTTTDSEGEKHHAG